VVGVVSATLIGLATPASAHKAVLKGWTSCSDGDHVVLWSIGNDFGMPMTIDSATAVIGAQEYPVTGYSSPVANYETTSATTIVPGVATGTITLTVRGAWPDRFVDTEHTSVELESNCTTTTMGSTTTTTCTTLPSTTTTEAPPTTEATSTTEVPTTTEAPSTTEVTTTTEAPTTSLGVQGSTTVLDSLPTTSTTGREAPTTTLGGLGGPVSTTLAAVNGTLPRTGSDTGVPIVFGLCCVVGGAALVLRRRAWTQL
jgi:LPXTG-motif cell wall-anchored protein